MDHHQQNSGMFRKTTSQSEQRKTILGSGFGGDIGRACSGVCGWGSQLRLWADALIKNRNCRELPASGCSTKSLVNGRPNFFTAYHRLEYPQWDVRFSWVNQVNIGQPLGIRHFSQVPPCSHAALQQPAARTTFLNRSSTLAKGPIRTEQEGCRQRLAQFVNRPGFEARHRNSASSTAYQTNILHVCVYI